ncbi:MAG: hypothetical protein HY756_09825 [Nitrospirae bacterium]|nr:hypothetical protein [Nitrospirota bacterium]
MKRASLIIVLALLLVSFLYSLVLGLGFGQGMRGSPHDFSLANWNPDKEMCRVCHVPHDHVLATQRYTNGLLWNHGVSSASYTMYSSSWSPTIEGQQSAQPDGTAKLCLGCHDGTAAIDTFDKYAGGSWHMDDENPIFIIPGFSDGANLDMRGTHPISIRFPSGQVGDGKNFKDINTVTWTSGDTVASTLDNGKVQCSTCHDVHDQETVPGTRLLRSPQTVADGGSPSQLCLTCHIK